MRSSRPKTDDRRKAYLSLISAIEGQLRDAYAKRHEEGAETQSSIAEKLGVGRAAISRRLNGQTNMTIKTLADLGWALGHCIEVEIFDPEDQPTNRKRFVPEYKPSSSPVWEIEQRKRTSSSLKKVVPKSRAESGFIVESFQ